MEEKEKNAAEKEPQTRLMGFELLKEHFPDFENEESVPKQVRDAAQKKGTELLYEYLMFENQRLSEQNSELSDRIGEFTGTLGNQRDCSGINNPLSEEFMRSLWG
ncbi:MAG: hypothetical protein IJX79_00770 [Clostridia bacterium]|nr:hypothetical protein [Clostridia bacterium]